MLPSGHFYTTKTLNGLFAGCAETRTASTNLQLDKPIRNCEVERINFQSNRGRTMIRIILASVASVLFTQAAIGQQYGTASEARTMLERVVAGIKADAAA